MNPGDVLCICVLIGSAAFAVGRASQRYEDMREKLALIEAERDASPDAAATRAGYPAHCEQRNVSAE